MNKILYMLSLFAWGTLPLYAHTNYPSFTTWDIIWMFAVWFGIPVVVIGTIIYLILKKKKDTALRLTILFIILGVFYFLYIGF